MFLCACDGACILVFIGPANTTESHMATPTRRGRPRDPQVAERDETIYQLLTDGPRSRGSIADATGHDRTTVRLSLQRLQRANRIRQCLINGAIVWAVPDCDCP
jgi:hypothetical protein